MARKKRDWCPGGDEKLGFTYNHENRITPPERRKVKFVRCRVCGQRFERKNRECDDYGCIHYSVPKHKAY